MIGIPCVQNKTLVKQFYGMMKEKNPDFFVEVGAYNAEVSKEISSLTDSKIHAFEANPYNYSYFVESLKDYGNISFQNIAIDSTSGRAKFFVQKSKGGKSFAPTKKNNSLLMRVEPDVIYEEVEVDCITLNDYFSDYDLTDKEIALWIDAEGKGFDVLAGATNILDNTIIIFIEVEIKEYWESQKKAGDVHEFLVTQGFTPFMRDREYPKQFNVLYVKENC